MDLVRIADLLRPFLDPSVGDSHRSPRVPRPGAPSALGWEKVTTDPCHSDPERSEGKESAFLSPAQLKYISTYIDVLFRWNARINLTAIRDPEEIVTRHFGESFFLARHLFPGNAAGAPSSSRFVRQGGDLLDLIDLGSGAGFPGLPIKIWAPHFHVTLIESNRKKATFLREIVRNLTLTDINVFSGRAEEFASQAAVVTLRAVERFDAALPAAAHLVAPGGRLALLIGQSQTDRARQLLPLFHWSAPLPIPLSSSRILLTGTVA